MIIPKVKQEVTVIGKTQNITSHFYRANLTRDNMWQAVTLVTYNLGIAAAAAASF